MKVRRIAAVAAVLVAGTGLAACSSGSKSSTAGGGGSKTLTYWASNQAPSTAQDLIDFKPVLAAFKKQTGITVKMTVIPWPDLYNKILTATSSGQGPDVLNIGNTWSVSLQDTGAFLPFGSSEFQAIGGKDKFFATSAAATGAPGQTPTSVPLYGLSYGLFYNKKLFAQAGISQPPATWAEFVADGKKLTKGNVYGATLEGGSITENSHWAFILGQQQGAKLFNGKKPQFDSPQEVAAVKRYIDLIGTDKIVSPSAAEYSNGTQAISDFSNGKAAMMMWQMNAASNLKANGMSASDYGTAPVPLLDPLPPGGKPIGSHVAGINVSIFKNTKNKDGALKFVKFITEPQQQIKLNQDFQSLPVINSAYSDKAFQTPFINSFKTVLQEHSAPMPLVSGEDEMETLLGGAVKNLFAKATSGPVSDSDIKAALTNANQQMAAAG